MLCALALLTAKETFTRVNERGMEAALVVTIWVALANIELLEGEHFVAGHIRVVAPPLLVALLQRERRLRLARRREPMQLSLHDILLLDGAAVEHGERVVDELALHVDWAPEADNHGDVVLLVKIVWWLTLLAISLTGLIVVLPSESIVLVNTLRIEIVL